LFLLAKGASEYTNLFIEYHLDLLDVLDTFPSCTPPLPRLVGMLNYSCNKVHALIFKIEFLPRLQPRYYSAACSPTASLNHFDVVFNIEQIPKREWMKQSR